LAEKAGVGVATVRRAEAGDPDAAVPMIPATEAAVRSAMEAAGAIFVPENGEGPGVRMKKQRPQE
jgi:DNA-binding LacI/PurR family transcriptional regulator